MPCQDIDYGSYDRQQSEALNKATKAACELTETLRGVGNSDYNSSNYFIRDLSKETRLWIKEHDEMDRRRLKQEKENKSKKKLKKKALSKLSKEERKVLGL